MSISLSGGRKVTLWVTPPAQAKKSKTRRDPILGTCVTWAWLGGPDLAGRLMDHKEVDRVVVEDGGSVFDISR